MCAQTADAYNEPFLVRCGLSFVRIRRYIMTEGRNEIQEYIKEVEELEKNYKPKNTASPCYDFFLDYMKCMVRSGVAAFNVAS
jgi:hypothetical protein